MTVVWQALTWLLLPAAVATAAVQVTVDGRPVPFTGTQPQMVNGRVLVPLRGVLETIGAQVGWEPAEQKVVAVKDERVVELRIGSTVAQIDREPVVLDVPAQLLGGRTMVPLRFVGEALGAQVGWEPATRTVRIDTSGAATPPAGNPPVGATPSITGFSHSASGWLRGGDTVRVVLDGTPGSTALFRLPGLVDRIAMTEISTGRYSGEWTVPANQTLVQPNTPVIGQLTVAGQNMLIQAATPLAIDTVAPEITSITPVDGSRVGTRRPTIGAVFNDGAGSGVAPEMITVEVNGRDMSQDAVNAAQQLIFRPDSDLPLGHNRLRLIVADQAGNVAIREWSIDIATAASVIKSFQVDAPARAEPGDAVSLRLEAEPGGQATYSLAGGDARAFRADGEGVYVAEYIVRKTDDFDSAVVTATFRAKSGESYTVEAERRLNTRALVAALDKPVIESPANGARVTSPLTVTGRADAGAKVKVRVDYSAKLLGLLTVNGTITEELVTADDQGRWQTSAINLDSAAIGGDATYTITAASVGADGKLSEQARVSVRR